MRRFELVEGSSSKFWEVQVENTELTVCFGRIGTSGQSKTKSFASATAASAEEAKLIKEKTGKGYQEVGAAPATAATAPAPATAATPAPAPAARAKPTLAPAIAPATPAPVVAPAPAPAAPPVELTWPSGGFDWDTEMRQAVPVVRGINVPPFRPDLTRLSNPPEFKQDRYDQERLERMAEALIAAGRPVPGLPAGSPASAVAVWSQADATPRIARPALLKATAAEWNELLMQCAAHGRSSREGGLVWAAHICLALKGVPFALERLLDLAPVLLDYFGGWYFDVGVFPMLRHALAAADDAPHEAALALAAAVRGQEPQLDCALAYLFPEIAAWAEDCIRRNLSADFGFWLNTSVMSPELALQHLKRQTLYFGQLRSPLALQLRLHEEAAMPVLELALDKAGDRDSERAALKLIRQMRIPRLVPALVERIASKEVRLVLDTVAAEWPAATLYTAIVRAAATRARDVEGFAVRLATRLPAVAEAALAACGQAERERFSELLRSLAAPDEAPADALPDLLREPPWKLGKRPQPVPTVELPPLAAAPTVNWDGTARDEWLRQEVGHWIKNRWQHQGAKMDLPSFVLTQLAIRDGALARAQAGEPLQADDFVKQKNTYQYISTDLLLALPAATALSIWNGAPFDHWTYWDFAEGAQGMLARHELAALPGLLTALAGDTGLGLQLAQAFGAVEIAPYAAHAFKNLKKAKPAAMSWLRRHAEIALAGLLPAAFGIERVPRENAQVAIRWLAANGHSELAKSVAARCGAEAGAALAALLAADPLLMVPAKMPKLPPFFAPATLRRPLLLDGRALPLAAVGAIGSMLAISSVAEPYAGLDLIKATCTRDSLAEFAWDLFEAWLAAGNPSKESWAFTALGLLGNDETARRLAPKIREWPGESAHARAVAGLDLLAAIGSDVALMHLNGIASKVKFKGLQDKAKEKIAAVAEARGFTPEELADRLVPDLGLDENGSVLLDFGPRRFHVGFDEALKPFVKDETGARLKDLPKPNKSDDAALAEAAVERFKALKKDAKAVASLQVIRLELAMCTRRHWPAENFRMFFLDHPLSRHLARRLVWGVYQEGNLADAFRVAEDLTLADRNDDLYTLPDDAEVGIAHALELPANLAGAFGQIFADYEILQPFRQLGRETYAPTADELLAKAITRFKDKKVATGSVMGLTNRGWERGDAQDGGWVGWFSKRLPGGLQVELSIDPGTVVGDLSFEPEQRVTEIVVRQGGRWGNDQTLDLTTVDPILVSEVIRDADLLAPL